MKRWITFIFSLPSDLPLSLQFICSILAVTNLYYSSISSYRGLDAWLMLNLLRRWGVDIGWSWMQLLLSSVVVA